VTQLEREKDEHLALCVDLYTTISEGAYNERAFTDRIETVQATCRKWKTSDDYSIQLAGQKMSELLRDIRDLAKHTVGGRSFMRLRALIDRKADKVAELLAGVNV
jgi:hypothetical protein